MPTDCGDAGSADPALSRELGRRPPLTLLFCRGFIVQRIVDMKTSADLSIAAIIPLYNGAPWIEATIRSVFAQTVQPDEFIVVDDGSTDDGPAIVEKLAQACPITLLHKPNGGQSAARNFGVAHSRSVLIALLDHDDRWYPDHLEVLRNAFEEHRGTPLGWAYSDFDDIDSHGLMVNRNYLSTPLLENPKRHLRTILAQGIIIQPSATLISRAAFEEVGGFDERLCGYEDDDLFLRIFRAGYGNAYIPHSTSQWRIHSSSCGASDRNDDSLRYYVKKLLAAYPDDPLRGHRYIRDALAPRFIKIWIQMYIRASRYRNDKKMREYVNDAISLIPYLNLRKRLFYLMALSLMRYPSLGKFILAARGITWGRAAS
jgi:glycosyltransferase involved in cell wall biosynthesis